MDAPAQTTTSLDDLPLLVAAADTRLRILELRGRDAQALPDARGRHVLDVLDGFADPEWLERSLEEALAGRAAGRDTRWRGVPVVVRVVPRHGEDGTSITSVLCLVMARAVSPYDRPGHFFQALLEHSQTFVALVDAQGIFRFVSPPSQALLGYAPEELTGRPFSDIVLESDAAAVMQAMGGLLERPGARATQMVHARARDGRKRQLEVTAANLLQDPELAGLVVSARDVSDTVEAWRAVEHGEVYHRALLEHAFDMIMVLGADGVRRYASPAVAVMLGFEPADHEGRPLLETVHPQDAEVVSARLREVQAAGGAQLPLEFRMLHRDGTARTVSGVLRNLLDDAVIQGLVLNLRDVTREREEARARARVEQAFNALASAGPYAVLQLDGAGRVASVNDAGTRMLDAVEGGPVGHPLSHQAGAAERGQVEDLVRRAMGGDPSEFEFATPRGTLVRASLVPVRGADGGVTHVAGLAQDVTRARAERRERDLLEAQLQQAQKLESIGQLAGGVAHDFNNILMVILAHASFLERSVKDPGAQQDLESIRTAAQRAAELTRQLLTVSRKQPLALAPMAINERLQTLSTMLRRLLPENIDMVVTPSDGVPDVEVDAGQFDQVVLNLCLNARDAMPRGGHLAIRTETAQLTPEFARRNPWATPGEYVVVSVADNGTGMTEDVRERVFEPFFTTKEAGRGTGLGLAMVYGIVKRHGGLIHCTSEPGHGSTFRVYLPAMAGTRDAPRTATAPAELGGTETVLVAEDDEGVREVVARVLQRAGYKLLQATHGEDAVHMALQHDVDLVVMDGVMPRLNGAEACQRIRAEKPRQRFLVSSGYSAEAAPRENFPADMVTFIAKPYDPSALLRAVRAALDAPVRAS